MRKGCIHALSLTKCGVPYFTSLISETLLLPEVLPGLQEEAKGHTAVGIGELALAGEKQV